MEKRGQVEVAYADDESVLDPLLNAPCFGCKNNDSAKHRRPKFRRLVARTVMLVSRSGGHEPPHLSLRERPTDLPSCHLSPTAASYAPQWLSPPSLHYFPCISPLRGRICCRRRWPTGCSC